MKKFKTLSIMVVLALVLVISACSSGSEGDANSLTIYTARSESLNNAVIPSFEEETGIKVDIVVAGTGELLKRVESEKNNTQADILWAADETMLSSKQEFFEEYISQEDEYMMDEFKNKSGYFSPAFADPTVFIVNENLIGDIPMEGFEDLLNPELKGKISFGDPTASSSAFQSLAAMLYAMGDGDPMSEKAWNYVEEFVENLDGKISGSSGQVHKGVADGEYPVGLTWEDPVVQYVKNGAPVEVVFPKEGAIFPGESVQIIKDAKNMENAKKFVDFLLSKEIQDKVGSELTVRPLRKDTKLADYMTPTADVKLAENYDEEWVSEHKDEITAKFTDIIEKSMD